MQNNYTEESYPFLVSRIIEYIDRVKTDSQTDLSLIDIIADFAQEYDIDVHLIGDAINSDVYFKSFIKKDCEHHKIFPPKKVKGSEW